MAEIRQWNESSSIGRRIAIFEDEPAIRENYAEALRKQGYEVSTYEDRRSAYAAFQQRLPELAIIDIGLSDEPEGGFDLSRYPTISQWLNRIQSLDGYVGMDD